MKLKVPLSAYFDGLCPSGYTLEYVLVNSRTEMKYTRDYDGMCLYFQIVMDEDWPEEYVPEDILDLIRDCFLYEDERAEEDRQRFGPYDSPSIEDSMPLEYFTEREDIEKDDDGVIAIVPMSRDPDSAPRTFIATDEGFVCEDCYTKAERASLGDEGVHVWEEGSDGWTGPVICARCESSLPVVVDGGLGEPDEHRARVALLVVPPGFEEYGEKDLISLLQEALAALVGARGPESDPAKRSLARALSIRSVSKL